MAALMVVAPVASAMQLKNGFGKPDSLGGCYE
jgi:hypothetical protein